MCDNASTDATAEIARDHSERDTRVRYVRNERNVGSLPNFNRAFRLSAPAPYFAWSAHDDCHRPDFLERLVGALESDPQASLAYGRSVYVGADGGPLPYDRALGAFLAPDGMVYHDDRALESDVTGPADARFERVLLSTMLNVPIHGVFRRSVLERSSLHQFYGSDTLLLAEAALAGPFRFVDAGVFAWRLHAGGTAYMTREEWAARETGDAAFRPGLPVRSLPPLPPGRRARGAPPGRGRAGVRGRRPLRHPDRQAPAGVRAGPPQLPRPPPVAVAPPTPSAPPSPPTGPASRGVVSETG